MSLFASVRTNWNTAFETWKVMGPYVILIFLILLGTLLPHVGLSCNLVYVAGKAWKQRGRWRGRETMAVLGPSNRTNSTNLYHHARCQECERWNSEEDWEASTTSLWSSKWTNLFWWGELMFPLFPLFMQVNAGENNELYALVLWWVQMLVIFSTHTDTKLFPVVAYTSSLGASNHDYWNHSIWIIHFQECSASPSPYIQNWRWWKVQDHIQEGGWFTARSAGVWSSNGHVDIFPSIVVYSAAMIFLCSSSFHLVPVWSLIQVTAVYWCGWYCRLFKCCL